MGTMDWRRKRNNLLVPSLSFKHLAVRGFLFCFHSCAPKREQRATFFTSSRVCRDIFFFFPNPPFACVEARRRRTIHNETTAREALFALGLKRRGKEATKAMCKTFNQVDKKHEENWSFWRQLCQISRFRATRWILRRCCFLSCYWTPNQSALKKNGAQ